MAEFNPNLSRLVLLGKQRSEFFISLTVGLLAAGLFLLGLHSYGMLDPTDSFFVEAPREMLVRGHYLTPMINYDDWFDKPAFPFWLIILSYKCFGVSAWAARIPSALSGMILIVVTAASVNKLLGTRQAVFAALVAMTCPLFMIVGRSALTDEPLACLVGVSLLGFARALVVRNRELLVTAYIALALSILCKGPIGAIIVAGSIVLFLILESWHNHSASNNSNGHSSWTVLDSAMTKWLRPWLGIILIVVIAAPYYLIVHATTGGAFTRDFFLRQNVGRFEGLVNHQQPFWWYLPVFLVGYFPWSIYLLFSFPLWLRLWRRRGWTTRQRMFVFAWAWLTFVMILFTVIPTKLPTYIVSITPAFAIIVAGYVDLLIRLRKKMPIFAVGSLLLVAGLCLAVAGLLLLAWPGSSIIPASWSKGVPEEFPLLALAASLIVLPLAIFQLYLAQLKRTLAALSVQALISYLMLLLALPTGFFLYYRYHQLPIDRLVSIAKSRDANLATLFNSVPSAIYRFDHHIPILESVQDVALFAKSPGSPHLLLATENCLKIPELQAKKHMVAQSGKWYLISVEDFLLPRR